MSHRRAKSIRKAMRSEGLSPEDNKATGNDKIRRGALLASYFPGFGERHLTGGRKTFKDAKTDARGMSEPEKVERRIALERQRDFAAQAVQIAQVLEEDLDLSSLREAREKLTAEMHAGMALPPAGSSHDAENVTRAAEAIEKTMSVFRDDEPSLMKERANKLDTVGTLYVDGRPVGRIGRAAVGSSPVVAALTRLNEVYKRVADRLKEIDMGAVTLVDERTRFKSKVEALAAQYGENPDKENQKD